MNSLSNKYIEGKIEKYRNRVPENDRKFNVK